MPRIVALPPMTEAPAPDDLVPIHNESTGDTEAISLSELTGFPDYGWTAAVETWSYSSFNSTLGTGVVTVPTDATTKYSVGMRVQLTQNTGGTKYAFIKAVTSTTLTLVFPSGITLNNEAISSPQFSTSLNPFGFPSKASFIKTYTNTGNGAGTGYFLEWDGIKEAWGHSGSFATTSAGNKTASLPTGFFTTMQWGSLELFKQSSLSTTIATNDLTTSLIQGFINAVAASTSQLQWYARGI